MTSIETSGRTRESWAEAVVEVFRPRFVEVGYPLPDALHISVGFPYGSAPENQIILAQTTRATASEDGVNHVFISPVVKDPAEVIRCILHELIHVALDANPETSEKFAKHTGVFAEIATRLGFIGKMTETPVGPDLAFEFVVLAAELGDFPHGAIDVNVLRGARVPVGPDGTPAPRGPRMQSGPLPQSNRYFIAVCRNEGDDQNEGCAGANQYRVRMTRKWIEAGAPLCGLCGVRMVVEKY